MRDYSEKERAIIWLCGCAELEYRERVALLEKAQDPQNLFRNFEKIYPSVIESGAKRVYMNECVRRERALDELLCRMRKNGQIAITQDDEEYPESLKAIPDPPLALFLQGNAALLKERKFCIVGSRITPPWAEKQCMNVSATLSQRFAIVTGLAEGGDRAAIEGALSSGKLISVLPNGLDECYPAAHAHLKKRIAESGLLITECAFGERVKKYSFHARNRILAGLSEGVLVVSAGSKSGTLITANRALDYGRDVFAFPHNLGVAQGAGCNDLIKNGAFLASGAEDILENYGIQIEEESKTELPEEEEKLFSILRECGEEHLAALADRAGMQIFEAAAILSALELKGLAVKSGGNKYASVKK